MGEFQGSRPLKRLVGENENRCIFGGCTSTDLLLPSNLHKAMLLCRFNFYLPPDTKLCRAHIDAGPEDWAIVVDGDNTREDFNEIHSQDILNILKSVLLNVHLTIWSALE